MEGVHIGNLMLDEALNISTDGASKPGEGAIATAYPTDTCCCCLLTFACLTLAKSMNLKLSAANCCMTFWLTILSPAAAALAGVADARVVP